MHTFGKMRVLINQQDKRTQEIAEMRKKSATKITPLHNE